MPKQVKIALKIIGIAFGVLVLIWMAIAIYVTNNKKELLETLTTQLNNSINGKLTIEKMEPALIRGFPGISVSLSNVLLQDSLYSKHHRNLLQAKEVFVALNVFSLIGGNIQIQKLNINDGKIYLFTDSLGNNNTKIFRQTGGNKKESDGTKIERLEFKNVIFVQENLQKGKLFNFDIHNLTAKINYKGKGWKGNINFDIKVNSFAFNLARGSFIKDQILKAKLEMNYINDSETLDIPLQNISIGKEDFKLGGQLKLNKEAPTFKIDLTAPKIRLQNVRPLLTNNISSKLAIYNLSNPFFAQALIQGSLKKSGDPKILISWKVKNNTLTVSGETVEKCSFTGYFNNEFKPGLGYNDANTIIGFIGLKGSYYDIAFNADTIKIIDLKKPVFEGRFQSAFELKKLNAISGSQSFRFKNGTARLHLLYRAPYNRTNDLERYIFGSLALENSTVTYPPRNLSFSNISGIFRFKGKDLFLENFKVKSGSSNFIMQASLLNFLNLYYTDPKMMRLSGNVKSPQINLADFLVFLGKRKNAASNSKSRVFNQLDKVLAEASVQLTLNADKLIYRKFEAQNMHASLLLKQSGIDLQDISLNHADGKLLITGNLDQSGPINRFNVDARLGNVNITKLFYAFENFGQNAIAYQNLKGTFNSRAKVSGAMRESGQIIPKSFKGFVNFSITNGAILNFDPIQKIGKFAFPNRDFSAITFTNIKNTLDINGSKINIRPMKIESSVLNVSIEGTYGMPLGTNIALRIPLRNPKKDIGLPDSLKNERFDSGIVINLKAQDDGTGNVKIKLGKSDELKEKAKDEKLKARALKKEERKARNDSTNSN